MLSGHRLNLPLRQYQKQVVNLLLPLVLFLSEPRHVSVFLQKKTSMKTFLSLLFLFVAGPGLHAQISGRLATTGGQPLPFASVLLLSIPDSTVSDATVSDTAGVYSLTTSQRGSFILKISSQGFRPWYSPAFSLTNAQHPIQFGLQLLREDTSQLNEVTIRSSKPLVTQTAEGTVVQVDKRIFSKGNSVLQLLQQSPGVSIDYRNNSLVLNGKSGVTVMLNGKTLQVPADQVVSFLNGMMANDVVRIELLSTPGASQDAEGTGGIIHIVTRPQTAEGTTATVTLTGGYGRAEKANGTASLHHQKGKWSWDAAFSFLHDRTSSNIYIDSRQNMPVFDGPLHVLVDNTTKAVQKNQDISLQTAFRLTSRTSLGAQGSWSASRRSSIDRNRANYHLQSDSVLYFDGTIAGENRWQHGAGSVYLDTRFRDGATFRTSLDGIGFSSHSPSEVINSFQHGSGEPVGGNDSLFAPRQRGYAGTNIRVVMGKADYQQTVTSRWKLETGLKASIMQNRSRAGIQSLLNDQWADRSETTGEMRMQEHIGAGYLSVKGQLSPGLLLTVGFRYEYARTRMTDTRTDATVVDRKQGFLFPNVSLSKRMTNQSDLFLSYSRRISRPTYQDLASFVRYSDPSAVYTGNPLLKPGLADNMKLGYSRTGYSLNLLLSRDQHPIVRYQLTEGPLRNLLYVGPQNLAWQKSAMLQFTASQKITDSWSMTYDLSGGVRGFRATHTRIPVEKTYFFYSFNTTQTWKLPRKMTAELSAWLNSTSYNGTIRVGPMGGANLGFKKELPGSSLQLTVTDLLRNLHIDTYYGTVIEEAFSIRNHVSIDTESRMFPIVKLTWSRSFGRSRFDHSNRQEEESKEERRRVTGN